MERKYSAQKGDSASEAMQQQVVRLTSDLAHAEAQAAAFEDRIGELEEEAMMGSGGGGTRGGDESMPDGPEEGGGVPGRQELQDRVEELEAQLERTVGGGKSGAESGAEARLSLSEANNKQLHTTCRELQRQVRVVRREVCIM